MKSRKMSRALVCALAPVLAVTSVAGAQAPRPKPRPAEPERPARESRPAAATLLVSADVSCRLTIDGTAAGDLSPSETRRITVTPGEHLIRAFAETGETWSAAVEARAGAQKAVIVPLKRAAPDTAPRASLGTLLISVDVAADQPIVLPIPAAMSVDGKPVGKVTPGVPLTVDARLGKHLVSAVFDDGDSVEFVAELKSPTQEIVTIPHPHRMRNIGARFDSEPAAVPQGATGARITGVEEFRPADQAGLRAGDVVTAYGAEPVADANQLISRILSSPIG